MKQLLDELLGTLADLLQSGYASVHPDTAITLDNLATRCEDNGLHTGAALLNRISQALQDRRHTLAKDDLRLTDEVCRAVRYTVLCQEKLNQLTVNERWQKLAEPASDQVKA